MRRLLGLPFSMLLPLLALTVWVGIVAVPTTLTFNQLQQIGRTGHNATVGVNKFHTTITPQSFLPYALNQAVITRSHAITALNLPGAILAMPVSIATTWPDEWYPQRLDLWTWRALTVPIYCLPMWWLAGVGIDALLRRRRLRWPLAFLATFLGAVLVLLFVVTAIGRQTPDRVGGLWVYAGLTQWILLLTTLPAAWLRQRRSVTAPSSLTEATSSQR